MAGMSVGTPHRVPQARCIECSRALDGATGVGADAAPEPGDITVCLYCGHLMAFAQGGGFRQLTDEEMREIAGDERILAIQRASALRDRQP